MKKILALALFFIGALNPILAQKFIVASDQSSCLYLNSENPLTIIVEGLSKDEIMVSSDNGEVLMKAGQYFLTPLRMQPTVITLQKKSGPNLTEIGTVIFKIVNVPKPTISLGTGMTRISTADLTAFWDVASLEWPATYNSNRHVRIDSFSITVMRSQTNTFEKKANIGDKLTEESRMLLRSVKPGDVLLIDDVYFKNEKNEIEIATPKLYALR
jgi:hypothetical protein